DRRGGRGSLRFVPALRDRVREGRHLRAQPDHAGQEVSSRPVTDDPISGPASDTLQTEDDEPPPKASAARFFLLPLLVVGTALLIFLVFNFMTFDRRSPAEYLQEVKGGGP